MKAIIILIMSISIDAYAQNHEALKLVNTNHGKLSGVLSSDKLISSFKGVPYAAPPVGDLRWKEPQLLKSWSETLVCDRFSASPYQNEPKPFAMWSEEFIAPPKPLSEDCLYLNIWTPAKSTSEKLPVLVWIYGGGFVSGSSACAIYDGEALARKGIIFVSINYRVGVFGFLAHPDLSKESGKNASGNYALMDQLAALHWVNDNINAFGGDPDKVTIAGQSAGSFSVQALVASPLSKGLFRGAIAHSGASMNRFSKSLAIAENAGLELSKKVNSTHIDALRKLPADSLLKLANTFAFGTFAPITDGYVLPYDMGSIFQNRKHNDVALMAGWVTGDAALLGEPKSMTDYLTWASATFGKQKDEFLKVFPATTSDEAKQSQIKFGNLSFAAHADHTWALHNASKSYLYQFSHIPTDKPGFPNFGAFHTSEVPYALHTLSKWNRPWREADLKVEKMMSEYWVNFVKTGNPNGTSLPEWKEYDANTQSIIDISEKVILHPGLFKKEFQFLDSTNK